MNKINFHNKVLYLLKNQKREKIFINLMDRFINRLVERVDGDFRKRHEKREILVTLFVSVKKKWMLEYDLMQNMVLVDKINWLTK